MKRSHDHLLSMVAEPANLHRAFRQASKGKRHDRAAAAIFLDLERTVLDLREELLDGTYSFGPYRVFTIRDPKERVIRAAPFRDRIVHHAICNVIELIFDRSMIDDSYACRVGKGNLAAVHRLHRWVRGEPGAFALFCDVRHYFDSVDHRTLLGLLARRLRDERLLGLLGALLEGGAVAPGRGLPIGNLTSQLFANVYLDPLDHFAKESLRVRHYLRYVDDIACLGPSKQTLWDHLERISENLASLQLGLNRDKSRVTPVRAGVPFLGFVVYQGGLRLQGSRLVRSRRLLRDRRLLCERGTIGEDLYLATLESLVARTAQCWGSRLARRHGWV
jgi:hypothetical protein